MTDDIFKKSTSIFSSEENGGTKGNTSFSVKRLSSDENNIKEKSSYFADAFEYELASERLIEKATEVALKKKNKKKNNTSFLSYHIKLSAYITSAVLFSAGIIILIRNLSGMRNTPNYRQWSNAKTGMITAKESIEKNPPIPQDSLPREKSPTGVEQLSDTKEPSVALPESATDIRSVIGKKPLPSRKESLSGKIPPATEMKKSLPAGLKNSDPKSALSKSEYEHDEYSDYITQFYEPVNAANRSRSRITSGTSSRGSGGKTTTRISSRKNRTRLIADIVRSLGGTVIAAHEHYGDYYKIELSLPEEKVEQFKNALAKQPVITSFSTFTLSSAQNNSTIILEMHAE